mgnify:CR=1 FL=1
MKKINWGIIGLGSVANKFADGFKYSSNANLLAASSLDNKKLKKFQKKFSINQNFLFSSYDELIRCKDVDIVYIALPHTYHFTWIIKCIENKKNVLTEKPATINLNQIQRIYTKLKKNKIFFTEGLMYRYSPYFKKVLEILKNGEIGQITSINSFYGFNSTADKKIFGITIKKPDLDNRLFNKKLGGGAILDLGSYPISLATMINKFVLNNKINYLKINNINKKIGLNNIDLNSQIDFTLNNKLLCNATVAIDKNLNTTKIYGKKGSMTLKDGFTPTNECVIEVKNKRNKKFFVNCGINIYSHEINEISAHLLKINQTKKINFPIIDILEIVENIKIIDKWVGYK